MKCAFIACGKEFIPHKPNQKFCSEYCRKQSKLKKYTFKSLIDMTYNCAYCGKEFISERKRKYCSFTCASVAVGRISKENVQIIRKQKSKPIENSLADINAKARELGLSYGAYMQKLQFEKERAERET